MKKRVICYMMAVLMVFSLVIPVHAGNRDYVRLDDRTFNYRTTKGEKKNGCRSHWRQKGLSFSLDIGDKNSGYIIGGNKGGFKTVFSSELSCDVWQEGQKTWIHGDNNQYFGKKGKRLEAIKFTLSGKMKSSYNIRYRVDTDGTYQAWKYNGEVAGKASSGKYIRRIQVQIKKKTPIITYNIGNKKKSLDKTYKVGTVFGEKKEPMTSFKIQLTDLIDGYTDSIVKYKAHSGGTSGSWKQNGQVASQYKNNGIDAISIKLQGSNIKNNYSVYYRTYVKGYGWMAWTKNGGPSGVYGGTITDMQVTLVKKGSYSPRVDFNGVKKEDCYAGNVSYIDNKRNEHEGVKPGTKEVVQTATPAPTTTPKPTSTPKPTATPSKQPSSCVNGNHEWTQPYKTSNAYTKYEYIEIAGCKICGSPKTEDGKQQCCGHQFSWWPYYCLNDVKTYDGATERLCIRCGEKETVSESGTLIYSANVAAGGCDHVTIYEPLVDKSSVPYKPYIIGGINGVPKQMGVHKRCVKCRKLWDELEYINCDLYYAANNKIDKLKAFSVGDEIGECSAIFVKSPDFGNKFFHLVNGLSFN